jgi:hypothetical protein
MGSLSHRLGSSGNPIGLGILTNGAWRAPQEGSQRSGDTNEVAMTVPSVNRLVVVSPASRHRESPILCPLAARTITASAIESYPRVESRRHLLDAVDPLDRQE